MNKKRTLLASLITATVMVGWFALPYHPLYQEWVCKGASLETLQRLQSRLPDNPALCYYLGLRLSEARRQEEAIPLLQRGFALDSDRSRLLDALAAALIYVGRTREAYSVLRKFYEAHPQDADAYLMMARFYLTTQTFAPAVTLLKDATQKFPENPECWALLAIAQQRQSDTAGAEASATAAVHLRPQQSRYWFLQAQILKQARKSGAHAAYERAIQLTPQDVTIQADLADYLARSGDATAAEKVAREVLLQKPNDLRASGALGLALARRDDPAASALLLKGIQNDPQDILILRTLHRLAFKAGDTAQAERWLKEAVGMQSLMQQEANLNVKLERNPGDNAALREMASLMGKKGEIFRCMQYHARAMKQVADAPGPLLAAANDLKQGGFLSLSRRLAEQSLHNSKTPQERHDAEMFLRILAER